MKLVKTILVWPSIEKKNAEQLSRNSQITDGVKKPTVKEIQIWTKCVHVWVIVFIKHL